MSNLHREFSSRRLSFVRVRDILAVGKPVEMKICSDFGVSMIGMLAVAGLAWGSDLDGDFETGAGVSDASIFRDDLGMELFEAIADWNYDRLRMALNAGADPDAVLPDPPPEAFTGRFTDGMLAYYTRRETGFSALMLASAIGDLRAVRFLLMAGADRNKLSTKHKTFALYLAAKQGHLEIMKELMSIGPDSPANRFRIQIDLAAQRAVLWDGDAVALSTEISSGKPAKPTPTGRYLVTNKYRHWTSTIYDAKMPYFLRLSCGDFGLHAGRIPGYPASSGCIRLPESQAKAMFSAVPVGTLVEIE